jgi:hypothetical protein
VGLLIGVAEDWTLRVFGVPEGEWELVADGHTVEGRCHARTTVTAGEPVEVKMMPGPLPEAER